jgi:uncharacterized protein YqfA (UPF0365 family)
VPVSVFEAFGMWFRRTPLGPMRRAWANAEAAGLPVTLIELEAHLMAGGSPERIVEAMIAAQQHGLPDNFKLLQAVELSGKDPLAAVAARYDLRALGLADP